MAGAGGRLGRAALSLVLALSCVPAVSLGGAGEALAAEEALTATSGEDLSALEEGDVFQASVDGLDMWFTVEGDGSVSVGRGNSAGGEDLAVDADYEGEVAVPAQVSDGSTALAVTGIQSYAFGEGSVVVKDEDGGSSVEYLGCALGSVSIPETVESIGTYAFSGCASLESVEFAEDGALETIGGNAFNHCTALLSADIPASVVEIGRYAFAYCTSMSELTFADDAALETIGRDAFACSSSTPGSLVSVEFPAVESIPEEVFKYQTCLEEVTFDGEVYEQVGEKAFEGCSSLETVTIPQLECPEAWGEYELMTNAFEDCTGLVSVVFLGDASDYTVGTGEDGQGNGGGERDNQTSVGPFAGCTSLESVVFMGKKCSAVWLDNEDAHFYYNVTFYGSEEDAEAGEDALGSVRVRDDVSYGDIKAGSLEEEQVFDDGGAVPDSGGAWAFEGLPADEDLVDDSCYAYDSDTSAIASCTVTMGKSSYICKGSPVELEYSVTSASGEALVEGVDYTATPYLDGEELDVDDLDEAGDYTLVFEGIGDYTGSTQRSFSISWAGVDWALVAGQDVLALAKTVSRATTEYGEGDDLVFLVGEDDADYALACLGAAGLEDTVVVVTAKDELSAEAQTQIRRTGADGVVVVGDYDSVSEDVDDALNSFDNSGVSVSRLAAEDLADAAARLYESFADEGLGADGTAYVVASDDVTLAAAVGTEAYENARPVFFSDSDGNLDGSTRSALKTGGFDTVVVLADSRAAAEAVEDAVGNDDIDFQVELAGASELSAEVAAEQVAGLDEDAGVDLVVGATADDGDAALAALYAARKGSALLLAGDEGEAADAVDEAFGDDWDAIGSVRFVGRRTNLPQDVVDEVLYDWYGGYSRFDDVSATAWYAQYVTEAVDLGFIEGYSDDDGEATGEYGPEDEITRAQVAVILYRASGEDAEENTNTSGHANLTGTQGYFDDEADDIWYTVGINWCADSGILYGDGDGKVRPNDTITREELACMLQRYADHMGYDIDEDQLVAITGVDEVDEVSSWATEAMEWVYAEDILVGKASDSGDYLDPQGTATRGQMAKLATIVYGMTQEL